MNGRESGVIANSVFMVLFPGVSRRFGGNDTRDELSETILNSSYPLS